jgi:hypothetical protein
MNKITALILVVAALIICGAGYAGYKLGWFSAFLQDSSKKVTAVSVGSTPADPLFIFKDQSLEPLTLDVGEGQQVPVIDQVHAGDGRNYVILLTGQLTGQFESQIYEQSKKGLVKLTDSPTVKFGLTRDAESGVLSYLATRPETYLQIASATAYDVNVFSFGVEQKIAEGKRAMVLEGGGAVLVESEGNLYAVPLAEGARRELMVGVADRPYAYDAESGSLALYNPLTSAIDFFDMAPGANPSYTRSIPVDTKPQLIAYLGGKMTAARIIDEEGQNPMLSLVDLSNGSSKSFSVSGDRGLIRPWRLISYSHL